MSSLGDDDLDRKKRNAKWAASQLYDVLGLVWKHEDHIERVWNRFKQEPEFIEHLRSLGLLTQIEERIAQVSKRKDK